MNRKIKFRAWNYKKIIYNVSVRNSLIMNHKDEFDYVTKSNYPIMQFTGLKDKNGIEIYEGDIVKYKTYYYSKEKEVIEEVKWIIDGDTDLFGEPTMYGFLVKWGECEVIGNIYENQELLNNTQIR